MFVCSYTITLRLHVAQWRSQNENFIMYHSLGCSGSLRSGSTPSTRSCCSTQQTHSCHSGSNRTAPSTLPATTPTPSVSAARDVTDVLSSCCVSVVGHDCVCYKTPAIYVLRVNLKLFPVYCFAGCTVSMFFCLCFNQASSTSWERNR